jgi:transcriptional regulator of acetoin/glycerol metabolism
LRRDDLPPHVLRGAAPVADEPPSPASTPTPVSPDGSAIPTMEEAERELIRRALQSTSGNKLQAARLLGISRHRLYDSMRRFGLD